MFKCDKCGWHVCVEGTDVCSQCARYESTQFYNFVHSKKEPKGMSELHQIVWKGMVKDEKKWRTSDKYIKGCGHPYVKDTQGKCVFCRVEANEVVHNKLSKETVVANLRQSAHALQKKAEDALAKALAIESGFYIPEQEKQMSNRQQAILSEAKWYEAEEPCKHCGIIGQKYVSNGRCRSCGK